MREITKSIEYSSFTAREMGSNDPVRASNTMNMSGLARYGMMFYFLGVALLGEKKILGVWFKNFTQKLASSSSLSSPYWALLSYAGNEQTMAKSTCSGKKLTLLRIVDRERTEHERTEQRCSEPIDNLKK